MVSSVRLKVELFLLRVDFVINADFPDNFSDVIFKRKSLENMTESRKLGVAWAVVPTKNWNSVFRLEHKGDGRIVEDYDIVHVSSKSGKVLHEGVVIESAMLSE